jgi:hypothetical protein
MRELPPWPWQPGISRESPGWRSQGARLAPDRADPPNEGFRVQQPTAHSHPRVPAFATCGNLLTTAPAALPVQVLPAALPVQVLPVQVSQAPEPAAMFRRSPELHPEISPIRN